MKVLVNGTDITQYVNESSYKIDETKEYEEWKDGNANKHRIYTSRKVSGSFEVALYGLNGMDLEAFMELWNSAVEDDVVTIGLYISNAARFDTIEAYYTMSTKKHLKLKDNKYVDHITVKIEEK